MLEPKCISRVLAGHAPSDNPFWRTFASTNAGKARWALPPPTNADAVLDRGEGQTLLAAYRSVALAKLDGDKQEKQHVMKGKYFDYWMPTGLFWEICERQSHATHMEEGKRWLEARRAIYLCQLHSWDESEGTMVNMFQVCQVGDAWFVRVNPDVCASSPGLESNGRARWPIPDTKGNTSVPIKESSKEQWWKI